MEFSDIFLESLYKRSDDFRKISEIYGTKLNHNNIIKHIDILYSFKIQQELNLFVVKQNIQLYNFRVETNDFGIWQISIYFEFSSNEANIDICDLIKYLSAYFKQTDSEKYFKQHIQLAMEKELSI